jgi:ABC-type lipoprotein release transport system permease subunit
MARYLIGADIRISQSLTEPLENESLFETLEVDHMTEVIRTKATFKLNDSLRLEFDLLAVDPASFPTVVSYPPGVSPFSMVEIMNVLQNNSPDALSVVISNDVYTQQLNIGDRIIMELGEQTYPFEVTGLIVDFPLVNGTYAITNLSQFTQRVDLESLDPKDQISREIWMAIDPDENASVIAKIKDMGIDDRIVGNSQTQLESFANNLVYREVTTAFELNALILIPLSIVGFFLIQIFSVQRRTEEFNVLQAMGLSKSQIRRLLIFEGFSFITLGLLLGTAIGLGLSIMMQPFLSQILPQLKGGFVISRILVDWSEMGIRLIILIILYGLGLLAFIAGTVRNLRAAQL